ncbi:unnamed protein product [marine sediment metagenome]|uniref:Uncharacterized protein n=1 Tax=marine sediment metagenome TaxID=412755 RepID=X1QK90_9ZZZZ
MAKPPEGQPSPESDKEHRAKRGAVKNFGDTVATSEQPSLFEFAHDYPINLWSFKIPGLGKKGRLCNHKRLDKFSKSGEAAYFKLLKCKRIECPSCWLDWARRTTFELALKIEAYARANNKRPIAAIMSVPPDKVTTWNWSGINMSLFRRGYRRIHNKGVGGGVVVFHPYRLNAYARGRWLRAGNGRCKKRGNGDVAIWRWVRARVQLGENLYSFVKLGPHAHVIGFGEAHPHSCKDYVIKFEGGYRHPEPLALKNVVGYLFYLSTHAGVLDHLKAYKRHRSKKGELTVRKQKTHTIREFGNLFRINPKELLGEAGFNALASEIATMLGMEWKDGELGYPAFHKELDTSGKEIEWVPIYQLGTFLNNEAWLTSLSYFQTKFWLSIYKFMREYRHPPEIGDIKPPPDIACYIEREGLVDVD